jgi:hypothetical protein
MLAEVVSMYLVNGKVVAEVAVLVVLDQMVLMVVH